MRPTLGQNNNPGVRGGFAGWRAIALAAALLFAPAPAFASDGGASGQFLMLAVVMAGAISLALAAALWALAEKNAAGRLRRVLRNAGARMRAAIGERDALLSAGREALIVWGRDGGAAAPVIWSARTNYCEKCGPARSSRK